MGEPRSGKTSFLSLLAARAETEGWTIFEAGGAQLQAGQMYIGQLEERLARLATELAVEKRVLWHVPDFLQLASSGTWTGQSASLLDQVMRAISAGRIVLLSEIPPDALTKLLATPGPALLHVTIDIKANVWPLVPPNHANSSMLDANPAKVATETAIAAHGPEKTNALPA